MQALARHVISHSLAGHESEGVQYSQFLHSRLRFQAAQTAPAHKAHWEYLGLQIGCQGAGAESRPDKGNPGCRLSVASPEQRWPLRCPHLHMPQINVWLQAYQLKSCISRTGTTLLSS